MDQLGSTSSTSDSKSKAVPEPGIPVFTPTWDEFKDFNNYILKIEKMGAHKFGLAKIIPPKEWNPCPQGYNMDEILEMEIPAPISQVVQGKQGVYQQFNIQKNSMKVKDLKRMAEQPRQATPAHENDEELERKYWRNINYFPPIYGADVSGSLTDPTVKEWNINKLGSILDLVNEDYGISIEGVNTAYLYFGMWKSSFAWHTEDMELYSINYLHFGEPKSWYSVPPEHGARLERLANNFFPNYYKECPAYLRHKMTVISPAVLKQYSIPFNKIVQRRGEFMITFPFGYHAGFNHGFNCAESTNFASPRWVEYGKRAVPCVCKPDMVKISMDTFVKRFQPDRYELWIQGKDIGPHPEIPGRNFAAPHPTREEILCNKNNFDVPSSYVEPISKRAKRHLIHQELEPVEQEEQQQLPLPQPEAEMVIKREVVDTSENSDVEDLEESYEIMKDIYYKAGVEMGSDELKEFQEEDMKVERLEEWEMDGVSKAKVKKPAKRSKSKSNTSGNSSSNESPNMPTIKQRRTKSESVSVSPPQEASASSEAAPPSIKSTPIKLSNAFTGYRIPKKAPTESSSASNDFAGWTDDDHNASRTLASMAGYCKQERSNNAWMSSYQQSTDAFCKTGIQKPSESSHIKSVCSVKIPAKRYPSPPPFASQSAWNASAINHDDTSEPDVSSTNCVQQQPTTPVKSLGDERRSRKQKSPRSNRSGLDSRDISTDLAHMWLQQKDWSMANEAEFNYLNSQQAPHCSVCSLFRSSFSQQQQRHQEQQPTSSAVLIPDQLFGSNNKSNTSILLRCSSCRVCVHAKCYGVAETTPAMSWLCRRCDRNLDTAKCCLCLQKGGALKPTSDTRWAHIVCALSLPGIFFDQPAIREPIVVNRMVREKVVFVNCVFCAGRSDCSSVFYRGVCLPCAGSSAGKRCGRAFHPTCGLVNGVRFTVGLDGLFSGCCCSVSSRPAAKKKVPQHVNVGQQVFAKHPDGRYAAATVTDDTQIVTYFCIEFNDGSTSQDTFPEDIRNYNCREDGPPPLGAAVEVLWTDGLCYMGHYRGQVQHRIYKLSFRDGGDTVVEAERQEFYHPDDDLPKDLRNQLSKQPVPAHVNNRQQQQHGLNRPASIKS